MKDESKNFVLFAVIAALILFGWPLIQGKFFPTANPPVTRIEDGKSKPIANPAADPAADGAAAVRNRAAVIVFPGRSGPVPHARMLVRHGYGVLMLDRRGEGASEGDFNARGWAALVAPVGTPDAAVSKVSDALRKVVGEPEVQKKLAVTGSYARPMSPAEVMAFIQADQQMWKPILERIAASP